jgi:3-oxoadipate enol-lactonase
MKAELPDITLHYSDQGKGLPVLLIHGFPLNRQMWADQIDFLSKSYRILVPDLRGHGETPPSPGPYSMELLADDCIALLDAIGIKAPIVVGGLSMGGYVAFALYRRYPERVAALILAATRASADSAEAKVNRDISIAKAKADGTSAVVANMLPKILSHKTYENSPQLVNHVKQIMLQTSLEGMVSALEGMRDRQDSTPLLTQIDVPVLVMHGSEDQIIRFEDSQSMYAQLPKASLAVLPDSGHLLNLEQPENFNEAVVRFLSGTK